MKAYKERSCLIKKKEINYSDIEFLISLNLFHFLIFFTFFIIV